MSSVSAGLRSTSGECGGRVDTLASAGAEFTAGSKFLEATSVTNIAQNNANRLGNG